ncbi:MAG TPA: hypothetical protein VMS56_08585 [Thermoanaerobaculia bacterium]|nr:hypothetical protein [Thermoanaerobaculia bacterium]
MDQERDKLLILEPDPLVTRAVELAAAKLDLQPVSATDGWDAIQMLEKGEYIAVVVDCNVPRHSGDGLLRYIWEEFGEESLDRVLVLVPDEETAARLGTGKLHTIRRSEPIESLASAIRGCEPRH